MQSIEHYRTAFQEAYFHCCILLYLHTMEALFPLALHMNRRAKKQALNRVNCTACLKTLCCIVAQKKPKRLKSICHQMHSRLSIKQVKLSYSMSHADAKRKGVAVFEKTTQFILCLDFFKLHLSILSKDHKKQNNSYKHFRKQRPLTSTRFLKILHISENYSLVCKHTSVTMRTDIRSDALFWF